MGKPPLKRDPIDDGILDAWARSRDDGLVPYVLITANRLQMGKTKLSIRLSEKVMENIEGRKWTIDQLGFDIPWLFERWQQVPEWTPLDLDEPNRPAGNRNWHTEENQAMAEWMQTRAYEHRPVLLPLPHQHLLDNAVVGIASGHLVVDYPGHFRAFEYLRDQLNRTYKTKTRFIGATDYDDPYAWDWTAYMKARIEYTEKRGKLLEDKVRVIQQKSDSSVAPLSYEDVIAILTANPGDYSERDRLSPSISQIKLRISYSMAQKACKEVNLSRREMLRSEIQSS